ncbi:MAG: penicillin-binding protein 1C [Bacteroidales bacterium]|nr:penicillin-binding protein 1C [Bacteroidales bacterium]
MKVSLRRRKVLFSLAGSGFLCLLFLFVISPESPFHDPYSVVLCDNHGRFLGGRIATDGQWRFPEADTLPHKFTRAILSFEDRHFYEHPGVNLLSLGRAMIQNIRANRIVSGGSTITMQLVRMSRKGKARTYVEKLIEICLAVGIELRHSKDEILLMYASHAPFGGNIVGIEAASMRFFGRPAADLSWAEAAAMAVLPNAPSIINVNRNRKSFLAKRNRLLYTLYQQGDLDSLGYQLAISESLPSEPMPLPDEASHYLEYRKKSSGESQINSTIDRGIQSEIMAIMHRHHYTLKGNLINHLAVIVRELKTGNVVAYQGNMPSAEPGDACQNDMIQTPRSSGSILKPFLYALMLAEGKIHPQTLVPDIPIWIGGFCPKNFDEKYSGAIPARQALTESLNIPFVLMLKQYGIERFHAQLKNFGLTTMEKPSSHYGLSLILGGAEVTLWELTKAYVSFVQIMQNQTEDVSLAAFDAGSVWLTTEAMRDLNRPENESGWKNFSSVKPMAWKTGTSFGFRDAWAIGITADYVIGVWAGNAEGNGRPGLTGVSAAAPVLFDVAGILPESSSWFSRPNAGLERRTICKSSGFATGPYCTDTLEIIGHAHGDRVPVCPYHCLLRLNETAQFQLPPQCFPGEEIQMKSWFVLTPLMEKYYRRKHPEYLSLPPVKQGCKEESGEIMEFVYPPPSAEIYQPLDFQAKLLPIVFEVAHRNTETSLFWHLDGVFVGKTSGVEHKMVIVTTQGLHQLVVVDSNGNRIARSFTLLKNAG